MAIVDSSAPSRPLIRAIEPRDFDFVHAVVDEWWGGRPMRHLLQRLFFEHFCDTSFALMSNNDMLGFLIGFRSQCDPAVAYIHFVGIRPDVRGSGFGRLLYQRFFDTVATLGCREARSITSPANEGSIAFHRRMGFQLTPGSGEAQGLPVHLDHGGPGQHRIVFSRSLP